MASVVDWAPFSHNPLETALSRLMRAHDCIIVHMEYDNTIHIIGKGVRLNLPYMWIVDTDEDELILKIVEGIKVSRAHAKELGY